MEVWILTYTKTCVKCVNIKEKQPQIHQNGGNMAVFTAKTKESPIYAMIGIDDDNGGIQWDIVDMEYAWGMFRSNVLEDRGSITVNSIYYRRFYMPPPTPFLP